MKRFSPIDADYIFPTHSVGWYPVNTTHSKKKGLILFQSFVYRYFKIDSIFYLNEVIILFTAL